METSKVYESTKKTFKRTREYQTMSCSFMVNLLTQYFDVELEKPKKINIDAMPFLFIKSLSREHEVIDVEQVISNRVRCIYESDLAHGDSANKAQRRLVNNKIVETLHYLIDLLEMLGVEITVRSTTGNFYRKRDNIKSIKVGSRCYNKEDITTYGEMIHSSLISKIQKGQTKFSSNQLI